MLTVKKIKNGVILLPNDNTLDVDENWFSPSYWHKQGAIVGEKKGRASTYFLNLGNQVGVLRHYWRGGLIGKLLSDQYLYTGLEQTRTYQEFALLQQLKSLGLPVPAPITAKIARSGLIYRGDLITKAIQGAESLLDKLKQAPLNDKQWLRVASTLAQFHNAGVFHADLNINNILFDQDGDVFLIDFDRGRLIQPSKQTCNNNMDRLPRAFIKELNRNPIFYWQQSNWQTLEKLYQQHLKI